MYAFWGEFTLSNSRGSNAFMKLCSNGDIYVTWEEHYEWSKVENPIVFFQS